MNHHDLIFQPTNQPSILQVKGKNLTCSTPPIFFLPQAPKTTPLVRTKSPRWSENSRSCRTKLSSSKRMDGWWFVKYFWNFHPDPCKNDPIWRAYFSNGLKPPTRWPWRWFWRPNFWVLSRFTFVLWNGWWFFEIRLQYPPKMLQMLENNGRSYETQLVCRILVINKSKNNSHKPI